MLIGMLLACFVNCAQTITCDPTFGPTGAGCPNGRICDPNGVCQLTCFNNTNGCTDPGTVCDTSTQVANQQSTQICQTSCSNITDCPTINGNAQVCYQPPQPTAPAGASPPPVYGICKRICTTDNTNWCLRPFQCLSIGPNPFCGGPPTASP